MASEERNEDTTKQLCLFLRAGWLKAIKITRLQHLSTHPEISIEITPLSYKRGARNVVVTIQ